ASWMIELLENDIGGTFNACSPAGRWTLGDLIDALVDAALSPPEPAWTDETTLHAHAVEPWTGLPLWLPSNDADHAGFMSFDCTKAAHAGLAARPLAQTIDDTAAWLVARDNAGAWKNVLTADTERAILDDICAAGPSQGAKDPHACGCAATLCPRPPRRGNNLRLGTALRRKCAADIR